MEEFSFTDVLELFMVEVKNNEAYELQIKGELTEIGSVLLRKY